MRLQFGAAFLILLPHAALSQTAPGCDQASFAAAVSEASAVLSSMNEENKKAFQAKLMTLKAREGWTDGDYAAKATPFAKDETTAALDDSNKALLDRVPQLGGTTISAASALMPADAGARHCAMLAELRALMARVIDNTRTKWAHMLGKLDLALDTSRQAKTAGQ